MTAGNGRRTVLIAQELHQQGMTGQRQRFRHACAGLVQRLHRSIFVGDPGLLDRGDAGAGAVLDGPRQALVDLAARGAAVLLISQDLDELIEIADRIAVMFHGRLSAPLDAAAASREKLGLLMGGNAAAREDAFHAPRA